MPVSVSHNLKELSTNCIAYVHVHTCTWIHEELNDPLQLTVEGSNDEFVDLEEEDENVGTFQVSYLQIHALPMCCLLYQHPFPSLVPRPLPDFILQPWRKLGRRPGTSTTSRTGNGGLG